MSDNIEESFYRLVLNDMHSNLEADALQTLQDRIEDWIQVLVKIVTDVDLKLSAGNLQMVEVTRKSFGSGRMTPKFFEQKIGIEKEKQRLKKFKDRAVSRLRHAKELRKAMRIQESQRFLSQQQVKPNPPQPEPQEDLVEDILDLEDKVDQMQANLVTLIKKSETRIIEHINKMFALSREDPQGK